MVQPERRAGQRGGDREGLQLYIYIYIYIHTHMMCHYWYRIIGIVSIIVHILV